MNAFLLSHKWQEQVHDIFSELHGHQRKTLAFFVLGFLLSGSALLQKVAEYMHISHGAMQQCPVSKSV